MHVHILGICGTFMGGIAQLAAAMGHRVSGSDANVYPPMSTQLAAAGIEIYEGFDDSQFAQQPDIVVIGNAMSRGNPAVEYVLNKGLAYTSGPQWLAEHVLHERWVLGVAGTHGKTTTSSLLAWILEDNDMQPGFLIGGVPDNFGISARLGETPFFVVEADEYDTAFFDKRSKFIHYGIRTLIMNNLEFDHADIFDDLAAIQTQFHHLIRTIPQNGLVIHPSEQAAIDTVIAKGCWTPVQTMGAHADWQWRLLAKDGSSFEVQYQKESPTTVNWPLIGLHNVHNAVAAIAAAKHVGVRVEHAAQSLAQFRGIKRRLELRGEVAQIRVYDDFAHHPTAIQTTLQGLRNNVGTERIIAVLEPRSNTMRMGIHKENLADALSEADYVHIFEPDNMSWSFDAVIEALGTKAQRYHKTEQIIAQVCQQAQAGDHILIMSNGGFENIHQRLLTALGESCATQTELNA